MAGAFEWDGGGFTVSNVTPESAEWGDDVAAIVVDGPLMWVIPLEKVEISITRRSAQAMLRYDARRGIFIRYPKNGILALGGISLMVERQFSKLRAGVRFSYPAPVNNFIGQKHKILSIWRHFCRFGRL